MQLATDGARFVPWNGAVRLRIATPWCICEAESGREKSPTRGRHARCRRIAWKRRRAKRAPVSTQRPSWSEPWHGATDLPGARHRDRSASRCRV